MGETTFNGALIGIIVNLIVFTSVHLFEQRMTGALPDKEIEGA